MADDIKGVLDRPDRGEEAVLIDGLRALTRDDSLAIELKRRQVAELLKSTQSRAVRNASALALVDLDARTEIDALLAVVGRPELAKEVGTMMFALDELGASLPLGLVTQIVETGSYEAKAEALLIVADGRLTLPERAETIAAEQKLRQLEQASDPEVSEAAAIVLAALDAVRTAAPEIRSGPPAS